MACSVLKAYNHAWSNERSPSVEFVTTSFAFAIPILIVEVAPTWIGMGRDVLPHLGIYNEGTIRHMQPL